MKVHSLIIIVTCCTYKYTSIDIMPELNRNIFHFGYGINFKYGGMLSHSFDRFYVVTKFILPTIKDLKFSPIDFDSECDYLNVDLDTQIHYLPNIKNVCMKIVLFVNFNKKQIDSYNKTVLDILTKNSFDTSQFSKE